MTIFLRLIGQASITHYF